MVSIPMDPVTMSGMRASLRGHQSEEAFERLLALEGHDQLTQLGTALLADDVPAKRVELLRDLVFSHRVAGVALGNVHPLLVLNPVVEDQRHAARLKLRKELLELVVGDDDDFVPIAPRRCYR